MPGRGRAAVLLDRGADPSVMGTGQHCAVPGPNRATVAKLLLYKANAGARNKDDLTPFSLAISENKEKMVGFLLNRGAKGDGKQ